MTHHHDHDHGHSDHHHDHHGHCHTGHHEHHEHCHRHTGELSFEEKMAKLLEHWLRHNADHADNYREWAHKAAENHMEDVGKLLDEIAGMTMEMNKKLEAAALLANKKDR